MGFKGKIVKQGAKIVKQVGGKKGAAIVGGGAAAAGAAGLAGGGAGGGGMVPRGQSGLYRVSSDGTITKVAPKPRRKKGYRMPRAVAEALRTQNDLVKAITFRVAGDVGK